MATGQITPYIERLVKLAGEGARSAACALYMLDKSRHLLKPAVVIGLPESYVKGCGNVEVGTQCCGRAVAHRKPWVVADMFTDPLFADARGAAQESGIRAGFSVPVSNSKNEVIGSLSCHYTHPYVPTEYDIERNEIFAKLIAFALEEEHGHIAVSAAD